MMQKYIPLSNSKNCLQFINNLFDFFLDKGGLWTSFYRYAFIIISDFSFLAYAQSFLRHNFRAQQSP